MNSRLRDWCLGVAALTAIAAALPVIVRESRFMAQQNAHAESTPVSNPVAPAQGTPAASSAPRPNASRANSPFAEVIAVPTDADRALLARYTLLRKELSRPRSATLDWFHSSDEDNRAEMLATLNATGEVNGRMLTRARRYLQWNIPQLEKMQKIESPWPSIVTRTRNAVQIDGKLDEPDWKRAQDVFIQYDRIDKFSGPSARAKLLWDEKFLYIGFTVPDEKIVAPVLERDGEVWRHDCVEFFVMPSRQINEYWELEFSPTGGILDYFCTKNLDRWGSHMQTDATMKGLQVGRVLRGTPNDNSDRDEGYTIEIAVPFNELPNFPSNPKAGDKFYGLLTWVNRDTETSTRTTTLAQVPFFTWFHNIWAYQPFVLSDRAKVG